MSFLFKKKYFHHNFYKSAGFIADINDMEVAIVKCLSRFVIWAGHYIAPVAKRVGDSAYIFVLFRKICN